MKRRLVLPSGVAVLGWLGLSLAASAGEIRVAHIDGIINTGTSRYVARVLDEARTSGAALVIVTLNTPGGLLSSTREIVQKIGASQVPVAVYVWPGGASATSAGTILTMSAHFAAMAPGTNIGAAHPVGGQGEDIKGDMKAKAENDTVAFIRAQAQLRARNADWAEQAIRKSISATADEALKLGVVDLIVPDVETLVARLEGQTARGEKSPSPLRLSGAGRTEIAWTPAERFLGFLGDPNVSVILMALGSLGIYMELSAPGISAPGIVGVICLVLSLISVSTLPVNYGGVALLGLGLGMLVLEVFVTSFGLLLVGGLVSILLGGLFLIDSSTGDLRLSLGVLVPLVVGLGAIAGFVAYMAWKSQNTKYSGLDSFDGAEGEVDAVEAGGHKGTCRLRGEIWNFEVKDAGAAVAAGERVGVVERRGLTLIVNKLSK